MSNHYLVRSSAYFMRCFLLAMGIALYSSSAFALSGNYTIDPSGSGANNYTSLSAAVSALNSSGASGDVTFTMASGSFSGGVTINAFSGSKRLLFKGRNNFQQFF